MHLAVKSIINECVCNSILGDVFGEDYSKSPSLSEWGLSTSLTITVPLAGEQVICDWPDTDENQIRHKFCSRHEGYGALCDCKTIHVLETIRIKTACRLSSTFH